MKWTCKLSYTRGDSKGNITLVQVKSGVRGGAVVEALRYKPEGRGIDSRLEFFIDIILPAAQWPWGDSTFNRNEYQEYFLGIKAAGA
jgi:hypothetical protein